MADGPEVILKKDPSVTNSILLTVHRCVREVNIQMFDILIKHAGNDTLDPIHGYREKQCIDS